MYSDHGFQSSNSSQILPTSIPFEIYTPTLSLSLTRNKQGSKNNNKIKEDKTNKQAKQDKMNKRDRRKREKEKHKKYI